MTIASRTERVLCGRLDEDATYRTVRPGGTTDWVLFVTVAGCGRLRRTGAPDILAPADRITVIEPHTPHDYGTDRDAGHWSLRWAHIEPRPDWLPLLHWPAAAPGIRSIEVDGTVRGRVVQALDRAVGAQHCGLRRNTLFAMNAVEEALLWCDTRNPRGNVLDPRLLAVLEHVSDHLDRPHTVASLARIGGLSPSRLAHLAAAQLGTGLMAHVEQQRMELARHLLAVTGLPVNHVARKVGFTDPLYFSRRFRLTTGMSPTKFRTATGG
ncbi:helix-turn-helix domain-containing protein [Kitasatospora acidiphila]|uniref:helix-turn-helix domain-containing protein n=1 Tax=Kitasatospora acidiphila TaxID=2567942 RepID=UPI0015F0E824|nr:helix-turn-helix domain-containing protein [Kitasatospora acidiphila]